MYKLLLFGVGSACKDLLSNIDYNNATILAYVDNNTSIQGTKLNNIKIIAPDAIVNYDFDYIIITTRYYDDIFNQLTKIGIHKDIIIGLNPYYSNQLKESLLHHTIILNQFCLRTIDPYAVCNMQNLGRERLTDIYQTCDYVRLSSLELTAAEIYNNHIEGNIAELGVFRGDFAKVLNEIFFDRKLYLFDTFEGFNEQDLVTERNNFFSESATSDFSNTSVDFVLSRMKYPQNCIVKKGYFPDTVCDLNEQFSFVSIDTDLFNPIYSGLQYFYPRLKKGGYIFIHDYNNFRFKGAKEAIQKYCSENVISIFPLSDISGSAVIIK